MSHDDLAPDISALRDQAISLAGGIGDLVQRASVYHHLYAHSGGNHGFPLLAAHGALWAAGYFRAGMRFGAIASVLQASSVEERNQRMAHLRAFADAFRDINRRVCVETYFIYHLSGTREWRESAALLIPPELLTAMDICHTARLQGRKLAQAERQSLFAAFFRWEQANIVGPSIMRAFEQFDWPEIRYLALRPAIRFAYFPPLSPLRFRDFADTDQRIVMGLRAFDRAEKVGWDRVEVALRRYKLMPAAFTADPARFFRATAKRVLDGAPALAFA